MIRFIHKYLKYSFSDAKPSKQRYMSLIKAPVGIKQALTDEQKDQINSEITKKLHELQNTGLSRQQILLSKAQKGIPLKLDPFFQFLKTNMKAREVYLKKFDRFTVENVVDIALRQDIGSDPSYSRARLAGKIQPKGRASLLLSDLEQRKDNAFDPKNYDANAQFTLSKAQEELKHKQPLKHFFKPIDKYENRKAHLRKVKKFDIHWRNIELLRQFVTNNGAIKSRYKSMLHDNDQLRIQKAVKTSRMMGAMPFVGRTPQSLKKNITSLEDDVQQIGYQHIDTQTGHIFRTRSQSMDSLEVSIEQKNDIDKKYKRMQKTKSTYKMWIDTMEPQPKKQEVKSEQYARFLKSKENQTRKDELTKEEEIKHYLKSVTGYRGFAQTNSSKIIPSDSDQCKKEFEKQKQKIKLAMKTDPRNAIQSILKAKLRF